MEPWPTLQPVEWGGSAHLSQQTSVSTVWLCYGPLTESLGLKEESPRCLNSDRHLLNDLGNLFFTSSRSIGIEAR